MWPFLGKKIQTIWCLHNMQKFCYIMMHTMQSCREFYKVYSYVHRGVVSLTRATFRKPFFRYKRRNLVYASRKRMETWRKFQRSNQCGALFGCDASSSVYPLTTLPIRRPVLYIPAFDLAFIVHKMQEEFASRAALGMQRIHEPGGARHI